LSWSSCQRKEAMPQGVLEMVASVAGRLRISAVHARFMRFD
jgi:hypothetical protein